jgi:hypothetical protein
MVSGRVGPDRSNALKRVFFGFLVLTRIKLVFGRIGLETNVPGNS